MIIDVHAHAVSEDFIRRTAARPDYGLPYEIRPDGGYLTRGYGETERMLWDVDARLESLERRGIDLQLVSPSPRTLSDHQRAIGVEIARLMNRDTAELVKRGGGRLAGMAVLPLGEPDKAPDELRRAIGEYGFRCALIPTSAAGAPLDLPQFEVTWETLEEHGLLVFMHGTTAIVRQTLAEYTLNTILAWPTEVTIAAAQVNICASSITTPSWQALRRCASWSTSWGSSASCLVPIFPMKSAMRKGPSRSPCLRICRGRSARGSSARMRARSCDGAAGRAD